jgi:hypothetical protein
MNTIQELPPIAQIDALAEDYAQARDILAQRVERFETLMQKIRTRFSPGIKSAAVGAANSQGLLSAGITRNPELFKKPRTMTLHGIKLGFAKGKGKITWGDEDKVVAAIRRHFAQDMAATLIRTVEVPVKDALAQLPAKELRLLGVQVEEAGDRIYIKAADSEIDKLVAAILKEGAVDEAEETAAK